MAEVPATQEHLPADHDLNAINYRQYPAMYKNILDNNA